MKNIIKYTSEYFGIDEKLLTGKSRKFELVRKREYVYFYCRNNLNMTLKEIGSLFNRDHSTVINGLDNMRNDKQFDRYNYKRYVVFMKYLNLKLFKQEVLDIELKYQEDKIKNKFKLRFENILLNFKGSSINETLIDKILLQIEQPCIILTNPNQ